MNINAFTSMGNTKEKGILRFLVYFDPKENEFVGICMDLGIIKTSKNPIEVEQNVVEAAMGYVETVCKENLPDKLLNQKPPREYVEVFNDYIAITSGTAKGNKFTSLSKSKKEKELDMASTRTFLKPLVGICHAI